MANEVVLAFFKDEAAADSAVEALKAWDKLDSDVKLSAIGVLTLDEKGKVKTQKLGSRSVTKGAGIGLLLALAVGPLGLGTVIAGGVVGALRHKGLGISAEDRGRIGTNLTNGQAAVGVLARKDEASLVAAKLAELGGVTESHEIAPEVEAEIVAAAPEIEAAEAAAGDDLTVIDGIGPDFSNSLRAAGVTTFAQLSEMEPEAIADVLAKAGTPLIAGHDASSWPRQATLAAAQDWSGLRRYVNSTK